MRMTRIRAAIALACALLLTTLSSSPAAAATVPGAPTGVSASPGNGSVTVSWTAPSNTGDSAIVSYTVTTNPGNKKTHVAADKRSATVTGLTNGTQYTFTVHATNEAGNSPESSAVTATPTADGSVPSAPTGVTATPGNGAATVAWTAPASNGGSAITSYVVTSSPGGQTATVDDDERRATVTGLTNGTSYTFTVRAVNANGNGAASAASNAVVVGAPGRPTDVRGTAGNGQVTVTWDAAPNNGSAITSSTVTASPGGRTATVNGAGTSATVTGLTNGTAYTFTVRSTNARGTGPASAASDAVRPAVVDAVRRLAGDSRIETAIEVSEDTWDDGEAAAVVLTRSDQFADALAGAPLAVAKRGPLLLTGSTRLDGDVEDEIERVLGSSGTVYVLGGTAAISSSIEDELEDEGFDVVRYAGDNRFETAVEIADDGLDDPDTLLLVTGLDFPDALAAGAAAARVDGAVLLTDGRTLDPATRDYLEDHDGDLYAIGGQAADAVPDARDVAGDDRYETAVMVAERFFDDPRNVGVASGLVFADALPGSAHIAERSGPMLLVDDSLPDVVEDYLEDDAATITTAHVYGGRSAVRESVLDDIEDAIR